MRLVPFLQVAVVDSRQGRYRLLPIVHHWIFPQNAPRSDRQILLTQLSVVEHLL